MPVEQLEQEEAAAGSMIAVRKSEAMTVSYVTSTLRTNRVYLYTDQQNESTNNNRIVVLQLISQEGNGCC